MMAYADIDEGERLAGWRATLAARRSGNLPLLVSVLLTRHFYYHYFNIFA
ncbi:hypothetical protein E2C01_098387 [Portunus trituberculatus]|uniref:Uncharacterized protein n=1 Tax=Portunus trituberculatus TaxID=210409 RepID=A0A5B7JXP1_PORTR|nr:hypothetical protein [Portunus trituberculatus]